MVAGEGAHVLDHAGHLEVGAPGHVGHPDGHLLGGQRRGGHDQQLGPGQEARQGHLDVARPRGHVDEEVVEVAPADVGQELLDRLGQHQPPPHEGHALVVDEEAHRDDLERAGRPVGPKRRQRHLVGVDLPLGPTQAGVDAQHPGHGEAPDVGVEDADGVPPGGQGGGQVDRDRGLADPALPAGHGQDPGGERDLGLRRPLGGLLAGLGHEAGPLGGGHGAGADLDAGGTGQAAEAALDVAFDLAAEGAGGDGEGDLHADQPLFVDGDVAHHAEVDDAGVQLGVDDGLEHAPDLFGSRAVRIHGAILNRPTP